jgi:hypothetical protein
MERPPKPGTSTGALQERVCRKSEKHANVITYNRQGQDYVKIFPETDLHPGPWRSLCTG